MKSQGKTEQFNFRLDPQRAKMLRDWVHDHGSKIQLVVEHALELVMQPENKPVADGQKGLAAKSSEGSKKVELSETSPAYNLHNAFFQEWVGWVILVLNSRDSGAIQSLAGNIVGFLAALTLPSRRSKTGKIHGTDQDAPDYAAEAEAAQAAYEQLRRFFERMRKRGSSESED